MSENQFEYQLIEKLCTGEINMTSPSGTLDLSKISRSRLWEYAPEIKTTAQLEQNFKKILERNNCATLSKPLSETEFRQVMDQISGLSSPYQAGKFLYGLNGASQMEVDLDDGRHVILTVFDQAQVGAGDTVYQIVNQIERPAVIPGYKDRRFDITLLINGLPIYAIELKNPEESVNEAINQLEKYVREKQFSGIYSTVQILMGMTPYDTKYMAACTAEQFNKDFAFTWKDENNRTVREWNYIADHFLTIPAAHLISTNYMILDGTKNREAIKVMRPYQINATRKALDVIQKTDFDLGCNKDGYIWHTTGSGKTITSYKTAALASRCSNIDKVVFVVDRKALTRQTLESYQAYDPENDLDGRERFTLIENTDSTNQLSRKLKSKSNNIIITSVQKLNRLVGRSSFKAPDKKILFIIDEAHRSTGTDAFDKIQKAFPRSAWIGYSGTPVFDEKKKGSRSVDVFGPLLHAYTIRDAIADKNVLGFKVDFNTTVPDNLRIEEMRSYYQKKHPDWSEQKIQEKIENITPEDMDDSIRSSFYDENPRHIEAVVRDIADNWENRSANWKYNALLTTHAGGNKASVPMALMYYEEFRKINEKRIEKGLRPIKVAISVSMDESNSDNMNEIQKGLHQALKDYNQMFGTNFDATTFDEYTIDLEDRLRKNSDDEKYLDLVIVVNRLLTGFDAPELNTLYVDRTLKGAELIQAYSRTNRVHDMATKPFGNVVNYRWPEYAEQLMNEALAIYSNKDYGDLSPEKRKKKIEDEGIVAGTFKDQIETTKECIRAIEKLTYGFEQLPDSPEKQKQLLAQFRQYNAQISRLKQYPVEKDENGNRISGFDYDHPEKLLDDLGLSPEQENLITVIFPNQLKKEIAQRENIPVYLVDLHVEHLNEVTVNFDYLSELLENLMNEIHDERYEEAGQTKTRINEFTDTLEDRSYAKRVNNAAEAIIQKEYPTPESGMTYPYTISSTDDLMKKIEQAQLVFVDHQMLSFIRTWGIQDVTDSGFLRQLISGHEYGKDDLNKEKVDKLTNEAAANYRARSVDQSVQKINPFIFRNRFKQALLDLADEQSEHE